MYDVLIRNGRVLNGTGNPWTVQDIGIEGDRIVAMGDLSGNTGKQEIDATGLVVAPGFIDTHVHSDLLCTRPDIHKIKVMQGVTTELFGQDGISVAPVSDETKPLWQKQLSGLNGDIGDWPWKSVHEYLSFLEKTPMNGNAAYLVPHGNVRTLVMGFASRTATPAEMQQMRELVEEGMEQGAVGVSSGLIYPPNVYSNKAELIEICKGAAKYNGCFVVHIRNESNHILAALDEVIDVARQSGVRLHVSHFKVGGKANRDKVEAALAKLTAGRAEGLEITFDQYPYTAGSTVFASILPPWMHDGGTPEMVARLRQPEVRARVKQELKENDGYENWVLSSGWENIVITAVASEKNRHLEGKSVIEIARIKGLADPADAAFDLLIEENANIAMVVHWGIEEDIISAMQHPLQMVGSDAIFGGKPHPRLYGTYARVLGHFVREMGALTLGEAVRKMTSGPAQLIQLTDRGLLREGYFADIVVFDPETVIDRATFAEPLREPLGIRHVLVNGQVAVQDGTWTGVTAGRVLNRQDGNELEDRRRKIAVSRVELT
ncbi:N-acyl-D-amino-acid deacylase family protein [Alicyclobacillus dauci]|uniref:D-aminoacylase n=1 Tax=Alicyclobacillus dauci TaxID=1475485 RepID=A0ABY6Z6U5_9BACL|nr:D-aminoacylase [Alicyclobacillus dauci]WAH38001.1 D-aminoacylase [Alicyclobacillus dauci]